MWLAGLRGAMAYALALKSTFDFEKGPVMLIVTLIYAFISILGVGSCMSPILERLEVNKKKPNRRSSVRKING
jgi:NhaP-type Na+/H+ or K+/H+ antiporter